MSGIYIAFRRTAPVGAPVAAAIACMFIDFGQAESTIKPVA